MTIYQQFMSLSTLALSAETVQRPANFSTLRRGPQCMPSVCCCVFRQATNIYRQTNANQEPLSGLASPAMSVKLLRPPYLIALRRGQYPCAGCFLLFVRTINHHQQYMQTRDQLYPSPSSHRCRLYSIRQISSLSDAAQRCVSGMCCCLPAVQTLLCTVYTASHYCPS